MDLLNKIKENAKKHNKKIILPESTEERTLKAADELLKELGIEDPLLDIAKQLETHALEDEYFIEKKLYPNVDFYSGIIYRALGIPEDMFTVMFALGRQPGWIAQGKELVEGEGARITRPRQVFMGKTDEKIK